VLRSLAKDPSFNVLSKPIEDRRGRGFLDLLNFGLTGDALTVILDTLHVSALLEEYCELTLKNPNMVIIISKRNETHHKLLSLPTGAELELMTGISYKIYECCRLATLAYTSAALVAIPVASGLPRRLVLMIQAALKDIPLNDLSEIERRFYIWVLFLTGIWAERLPERAWFIERLRGLLEREGIARWTGLKSVVTSFLWMSYVCDEGGMNLWDDMASELRKRGA
jgi:hypothetical protein